LILKTLYWDLPANRLPAEEWQARLNDIVGQAGLVFGI